MTELITLINSVGFPIIACIYLAENNRKQQAILFDLKEVLNKVLYKLEMEECEHE